MRSISIHLPHHEVDGVSAIYVNSALRYLAISLVQIFVPIYIWQLTGSFAAIFFYYIYARGIEVLLVPILGRMINRFGFRLSVFISNILLCFYLLALVFASKNLAYLIFSASILPVLALFYWLPYHSIFTVDGDKRHFQKQVASSRIISRLFPALGPIAGGLVITLFGFASLYFLSIVLVIISSLPLFLMPHHHHDWKGQWLTLFADVWKKKFRGDLLAFLGVGLEDTVFTYLWPVFIFLAVKDYEVLGGIASLSLLVAVVMLYLMGKLVKEQEKVLFRFGIVMSMVVWWLRILARSAAVFLSLDIFYHLAGILVWVPFDTRMYEKAAENDDYHFLLKRSISVNLGRMMGFVFAGLLFWFGAGWIGVFGLGSISLLLIRKMGE